MVDKKKEKTTKTEKITKDMQIGEIIQKKPEAAMIMMEHGLHCIGCMASRFESLEQGCQVHGMSDEQIDEMIDKLNKLK
jgi:hybrid cluster-associated redox disulfide protein